MRSGCSPGHCSASQTSSISSGHMMPWLIASCTLGSCSCSRLILNRQAMMASSVCVQMRPYWHNGQSLLAISCTPPRQQCGTNWNAHSSYETLISLGRSALMACTQAHRSQQADVPHAVIRLCDALRFGWRQALSQAPKLNKQPRSGRREPADQQAGCRGAYDPHLLWRPARHRHRVCKHAAAGPIIPAIHPWLRLCVLSRTVLYYETLTPINETVTTSLIGYVKKHKDHWITETGRTSRAGGLPARAHKVSVIPLYTERRLA